MKVATQIIKVQGLEQVKASVITEQGLVVYETIQWSQGGAISQCLKFINKYAK
jgi:hypothetical protein